MEEKSKFTPEQQEVLDRIAEKMKRPVSDDPTDYYAHIDNQLYVKYFTQLLYGRMELTNYSYPTQLFEEGFEVLDFHVNKCLEILYNKILKVVQNAKNEEGKWLDNQTQIIKSEDKHFELRPLLEPVIAKYEEEVIITQIDLDIPLVFIPDFPGEDEFEYDEFEELLPE